jgi:1-acyl-sn-glycerol-3-phosphate acyltransferase
VRFVYPLARREVRLALRARWCRRVLAVLGVDLEVIGTAPAGCHLIAANHISWLDIFVIGAAFPCCYVSKDETRAWPFMGWMAAANDTLFLRRGSARAAWRMNARIRERFDLGQSVVIFPEGTTTDGTLVRDFFPALFQPAIDRQRPVLPLAIAYFDEAAHTATSVAYIDDDPLWKSLHAVLEAPRTAARLILHEPLHTAGRPRRSLATLSCEAIRRSPPHRPRIEQRNPLDLGQVAPQV